MQYTLVYFLVLDNRTEDLHNNSSFRSRYVKGGSENTPVEFLS